jgi:hypothetical protein
MAKLIVLNVSQGQPRDMMWSIADSILEDEVGYKMFYGSTPTRTNTSSLS